MKKSRIVIAVLFVLLAPLAFSVHETSATLYCNRPYTELGENPGRPLNAIGYLNNGCTAFLIDANHIAAAAHCFVNTSTGAWQTDLRFYPNFHPDRVAADEYHVPRGDVTHVVVGSRAGESVLGTGMDWGIARVENWRDTAGLDMRPLYLTGAYPPNGTPLMNPAYTRHHFPYNDNDADTWDNMSWDTTNCGWVGSNGGMWAINMQTAPFYDGTNRDRTGCNSRWAAGMVHADCTVTNIVNDVVVHNCDTVGGSSGSPIMYQPTTGAWRVIGVTHGGGSTDFSQLVPVCTPDTPIGDNVGASARRFRFAPRFAANVAVHRSPNNPSATALFAVDSDLNRVVYRYRNASSPTYTSQFEFWGSMGTPYRGAKLTKIAACSRDSSGDPQVFVIADDEIYTRAAFNGVWSSWQDFGMPSASGGVVDIDASADANGRCMLFAAGKNGGAYTRTKSSEYKWGPWHTVAIGSFKAITALNYGGTIWAGLVDTAGDISLAKLGTAGWITPKKLSRPYSVSAWADVDMTWDEAARGFMLAIPTNSGNKLWFMPLYGSNVGGGWYYFDTNLWAPNAAPQNAPNAQSITASRWMEDPPGTTSPVVFITDDFGNIYFVEYARVAPVGWNLKWKSFYHETIPYP